MWFEKIFTNVAQDSIGEGIDNATIDYCRITGHS